MHVLMLAQYFPPDVNGASTRVYNAARALLFQGCKVTIVTSFPHYPNGHTTTSYRRKLLTREEIDGVKVLRTWIPNLSHSSITQRMLLHTSFMLSSLLGLICIRRVDIIFAMNPNIFSFFPALMYKILFRKNIIRNVDDLWPEVFYDLGIVKSGILRKVLDYLAKLSYRVPAAIIPISCGYVKTLVVKYGIPRDKIIVIEHGVDTLQFHSVKMNSHTTKSTCKTIMYSGALNIGYDFETVIKAAKLIKFEPVYFIIRGKGELSDSLTKMIEDYDVSNVVIRTDYLSKAELVSILNLADIFLLPMSPSVVIDQGLPTKVLEYQALGKPIVCISTGEAGRYIIKTQSGLVDTTRQPEELARLIMKLVNDEDLAKRLGSNGLNNINKNLTLEMVGKRLMTVISRSM
jgi:colanic acid biosynthesis glycosyl transferase WcaI